MSVDSVRAAITAVAYHLPPRVVTNEDLAAQFPEWPADRIVEKTGIVTRHVAGPDECASDLAVAAAHNLFDAHGCRPDSIDFVLLCTQSPDHPLPTTACLIQHRLGLPTSAGALDFNLGCSGFVYGLGLAKGLVETGQARRVLLLTAETYSKYLHPRDKSTRTLFGDGAAATLVEAMPPQLGEAPPLGPFVYGTDGVGGPNLRVAAGGARTVCGESRPREDGGGPEHLWMNGTEIFTFTLRQVPAALAALWAASGLRADQVDLFVFHQANQYMLESLRRKLSLAPERFVLAMRDSGNTVSATIPIALVEAACTGQLRPGMRVALVGFGVGYSWAACMLRWDVAPGSSRRMA